MPQIYQTLIIIGISVILFIVIASLIIDIMLKHALNSVEMAHRL